MRADIDLRVHIGSDVLDQGYRPTCVAFASSSAHEALLGGAGSHLAPEAIWWQATVAGHTSANGMILDAAGPALTGYGQPGLSSWPYNHSLGAATEEPPTGLSKPPWRRANLQPVELKHDGIEDAIENELERTRPVILVIELTDGFHLPDEEGVVPAPDVRADAGGYHAVICVGAANHPVYGRMLLIKNSWGEDWGLGGYCWLPIGYLIGFAAQAAIVEDETEK
tara:strand:+ start:5347 stop:6018 length:672 start_codon:yes stop_codon:yes gene_type:complete